MDHLTPEKPKKRKQIPQSWEERRMAESTRICNHELHGEEGFA
jgi:hypothetical protein